MEALRLALMVWISGVTGLLVPAELPQVVYASDEQLCEVYTGKDCPADASTTIVALYHRVKHTMYLPDEFDVGHPYYISVLVHELTHHMQSCSDRQYPCVGAIEREAYAAGFKWLESMGLDALAVSKLDMLSLIHYTSCRRG